MRSTLFESLGASASAMASAFQRGSVPASGFRQPLENEDPYWTLLARSRILLIRAARPVATHAFYTLGRLGAIDAGYGDLIPSRSRVGSRVSRAGGERAAVLAFPFSLAN